MFWPIKGDVIIVTAEFEELGGGYILPATCDIKQLFSKDQGVPDEMWSFLYRTEINDYGDAVVHHEIFYSMLGVLRATLIGDKDLDKEVAELEKHIQIEIDREKEDR